MSILIVGSEGSMGKRYQAILKYLDKETMLADFEHRPSEVMDMANLCEGIIIATPTDTHMEYLYRFSNLRKPILCEKPLTKNKAELELIENIVKSYGTNLTMMMQYKILESPSSQGLSYYNYFRHGTDGLVWDCIQIIGLAKSRVELAENSPVWKCDINGFSLNIADMDKAYIEYVKNWLSKPGQDVGYLMEVHNKTINFEYKK